MAFFSSIHKLHDEAFVKVNPRFRKETELITDVLPVGHSAILKFQERMTRKYWSMQAYPFLIWKVGNLIWKSFHSPHTANQFNWFMEIPSPNLQHVLNDGIWDYKDMMSFSVTLQSKSESLRFSLQTSTVHVREKIKQEKVEDQWQIWGVGEV